MLLTMIASPGWHRIWDRAAAIRGRLIGRVTVAACLVAAPLWAATLPGNSAASTGGQGEREPLQIDSAPLAEFTADLNQYLPVSGGVRYEVLDAGVPHGIVYLEDTAADPVDVPGLVRDLIDIAGNHGLQVEQLDVAGPPRRAGIIVSAPFPTLRFCWERHPLEDVPATGGLWTQPFADLGDVETVHREGARVTLELEVAAAGRIDGHAAASGHRRFRVHGVGLDTELPNAYTWMPGLRKIPDVPRHVLVDDGRAGRRRITVEALCDAFTPRVAARERLAAFLDVDPSVLGKAAPSAPRYREPLMLWAVDGRTTPGEPPFYAPWFGDAGAPRRWVSLRAGDPGAHWVALDAPWQLRVGEGGAAGRFQMVRDTVEAGGDPVYAFLRRHVGMEVAVLMEGAVIGTLPVESAGVGVLEAINPDTDGLGAALERWHRVYGLGDGNSTEIRERQPARAERATRPEPDYFQVRLMAEPQDREIIPVTHFDAPGAREGVLVAVQNDVILDSSAVTGARLEQDAERLYMHLSLTEAGRNALADACFVNLGKQLAIVYEDQLLCAPTIMDWEQEELTFKGMNDDWPDVAAAMAERLGRS